jgi:hypothetical protein
VTLDAGRAPGHAYVMSGAELTQARLPAGKPYLEQRLFIASPFGGLVTAALLFAVPFGIFLGVAALSRVPTVQWSGRDLTLHNGTWPAFVLSLLVAAALSMQRYVRLKDAGDAPRFAEIFTGGAATAIELASYAPEDARLGRAALIGVVLGLMASAVILLNHGNLDGRSTPMLVWFVVQITLSAVLFARGAELSRKSTASFDRRLRQELKIDLLRIDRLSVLGRSVARASLVWFVVSAVACLFFVGGNIDIPSVAIMLACAAMGVWIFLQAMMRVHRKIQDAKTVELEHLRCEIESARAHLKDEPNAAQRAQGLLAYEARIEAAPEWPFDQTTLMRMGASTLIVTVPWFGQAIVQYFIEHLGQK